MNPAYSLYIENVMMLAATIVIKSESAANSINRYLIDVLRYPESSVDGDDPTTWRYYKNLAGEYHFADEMMTVVSMDTLETIEFTKENLAIHRATSRAYQYGTRQYQALVLRYPSQNRLILGVLYPVDKAVAIAAADHAILGYPPGTVEENEYTFIERLQRWIDDYHVRWSNDHFGLTHGLYASAQLGVMYSALYYVILGIRRELCKTSEAHSFHVGQYLASHHDLAKYKDQLTTKQALWLYRNISYIEANFGKQDTFDWLIEHIMTERKLPVGSYTMRHDVTSQVDNIYPDLLFRKTALNKYNTDLEKTYTLGQMLEKENPLARMNPEASEDGQSDMDQAMKNSLSSVVTTKMVESSVVDRSNNTPYTLPDILLNHWLYLSQEGLYNSHITITDPVSGEQMPISTKDAFVMMFYAYGRAMGIDFEHLPTLVAKRVQRLDNPSTADLMSVVDSSLVPEQLAADALSVQPTIGNMISVDAFYETGYAIYQAAQIQRKMTSSQQHFARRGQVHGMVSRIYADKVYDLSNQTTP